MTASSATRIVELVELLNSYSRSYYVEGLSPVSDGEYDELYRELVGLEEQDPDHVLPESPTQRVGAPLPEGEGLKKVQHEVPMLSIASPTPSASGSGAQSAASVSSSLRPHDTGQQRCMSLGQVLHHLMLVVHKSVLRQTDPDCCRQ